MHAGEGDYLSIGRNNRCALNRARDDTMSVLEIWGAEYQENDCLLIKPEDRGLLEAVAARERSILQVLPHYLLMP